MTAGRVLHVFKYFRPHFTGEGTFLERIVLAFNKLAPEVEHDVLCTLTQAPDDPVRVEGIGSVDYLTPRGNKSLLTFIELFWWTLRNVRRYDTVHYHTHVDRTFMSYALAAMLGKRIVISATLDDSASGIAATYRAPFRPIVRWLLGRFDAFVSISPKLHEETIAALGYQRAHLIPMGIFMPEVSHERHRRARAQIGVVDDKAMLLSVGAISGRKDQMTLVRALRGLAADFPNVLLILVGPVLEPDYAQDVAKFIAENGLDDHVRFAGWIPEPWPYFAAADAMVFASVNEGFGTSMIEAMAFEVPVVARRLAGVNDVFIKSGETGFLFDDEKELEAQTRRLLSDVGFRRSMGKAARDFVVPRYAMQNVAAKYLSVYGFDAGLRS